MQPPPPTPVTPTTAALMVVAALLGAAAWGVMIWWLFLLPVIRAVRLTGVGLLVSVAVLSMVPLLAPDAAVVILVGRVVIAALFLAFVLALSRNFQRANAARRAAPVVTSPRRGGR